MEPLTATKRIELEIEIREESIMIAQRFGLSGVEFFCRQFPDIAKEYAQALDKENDRKIGFHVTKT
jgi:hypothetical protein